MLFIINFVNPPIFLAYIISLSIPIIQLFDKLVDVTLSGSVLSWPYSLDLFVALLLIVGILFVEINKLLLLFLWPNPVGVFWP